MHFSHIAKENGHTLLHNVDFTGIITYFHQLNASLSTSEPHIQPTIHYFVKYTYVYINQLPLQYVTNKISQNNFF